MIIEGQDEGGEDFKLLDNGDVAPVMDDATREAYEAWAGSGESADDIESDERAEREAPQVDDAPAPAKTEAKPKAEPKAKEPEPPKADAAPALDAARDFAARRKAEREKLATRSDDKQPAPETAADVATQIQEAKILWGKDKRTAARRLLGATLGVTDSTQIDALMRDLLDEETSAILGVGVDSSTDSAESTEAARLRRENDELKQRVAQAEQEQTAYQESVQRQAALDKAHRAIASSISSDDFPFLHAQVEVDPSELVLGMIMEASKRGELDESMSEADLIATYAKKADQEYRTMAQRFEPLFRGADSEGTKRTKQAPDKKRSRGSGDITNAQASESGNLKPRDEFIEDEDESKRNAWEVYRSMAKSDE